MHLHTITIFPTLRETKGTVPILVKMISSDCMKSKPKFKSQFKYGRLYTTIEFDEIFFLIIQKEYLNDRFLITTYSLVH